MMSYFSEIADHLHHVVHHLFVGGGALELQEQEDAVLDDVQHPVQLRYGRCRAGDGVGDDQLTDFLQRHVAGLFLHPGQALEVVVVVDDVIAVLCPLGVGLGRIAVMIDGQLQPLDRVLRGHDAAGPVRHDAHRLVSVEDVVKSDADNHGEDENQNQDQDQQNQLCQIPPPLGAGRPFDQIVPIRVSR